ncbi:MAG: hypothetical protein NT091_04780 [Candidatus Falkowbacteria bacterium]|nr:hypothetical protein [Candidatus Falkowbacteria bacterium]
MFKEPVFKSIKVNESKQDKILAEFTPEQQIEIEKKRKILSSLAFFIGKDFQIPVELNEPGKGWYWNFKDNIIRIDPKDLLEKSIDELRYLICHEGGHRRILRTDFIPSEIWNQPGFSFMMNAIEDPRDDNFVAECYPKFREQMKSVYAHHLELEEKTKEKAAQKLGYQPRFMQAGFEYIKQWFMETQEQEMQMSVDLPDEVKAVVQATIESAQDSWWRYPSKQEADSSEELIRQYAENSYKINLNKIWPEFKKLVEQDQADQEMQEILKEMQKILKDMQKGESDGESSDDKDNIPQDLKDNLSEEEQKELEQAIEKVLENAKKSEGQDDKDEDKKVEDQIE